MNKTIFISLSLAIINPVCVLASDVKSLVDTARNNSQKYYEDAKSIFPNAYDSGASEAKKLVEELKDRSVKSEEISKHEKIQDGSAKYIVFVSESLGDAALDEIIRDSLLKQEVLIVFNGVRENEKLNEGINRIQRLAAKYEQKANISINPNLFDHYKVKTVPTVIHLGDGKRINGYKPVISRVTGIGSVVWMAKNSNGIKYHDFGVRGPVNEISEPSLIEVAKKKILDIDWNKKKEDAIASFWKNYRQYSLAKANQDSLRTIDPSVKVTKDIKTPDGKYVAKAGQVINPLKVRNFTQELIIFDPTDAKQLKFAVDYRKSVMKVNPNKRLTFIVTEIDKVEGWKFYEKVTNALDQPIFTLTPDVIQRFELQRVPSVVMAENFKFKVREYKLND